jgi:hypothetical protein
VENVKSVSKSSFRPFINEEECDEEVVKLMQKCWSEEHNERPDFQTLKPIIRKLNK